MAPVPLTVVLRNPSTNISISLTSNLEQVQISTSVPGGFGTFTFRMDERVANLLTYPLQGFYACDVSVTDVAAQILFEGILTDVKMHSDADSAYYSCECTGWQVLLDNPYRNMVVERNLNWQVLSTAINPNLCRPDLVATTIGALDPSNPTQIGFRMDAGTSQAVFGFALGGAQLIIPSGMDSKVLYFDYSLDMNHTVQFDIEYQVYDAAGSLISNAALFGAGAVGSGSSSLNLGLGVHINIYMVSQSAATPTSNCFAKFYNMRIVTNRWSTIGYFNSEPVAGHELIADILHRNGQLNEDLSGIDPELTYTVQEFSYPQSVPGRQALDDANAYYSRYWAVWENKKLFWKAWNTTTADWIVSRDGGAQVDIDPSIVDAGSVVRVQYTDPTGLAVESDVADARADNIYKLAGRTKTVIANLGIVSTTTAATQVGSVFFPDHSYEVVGGTITLPAQTRCFSQTYGNMRPAYLIRAGETVRLRDGRSVRSIFDNSSWNRATFFRITATDLDWESQTIQLTIDNSQASLDQLTARIATNQSSKYGT